MEYSGPEIGARIARLRGARGWSARKVAGLLHVAPTTLGLLESGKTHTPHANTLLAIEDLAHTFGWPTLEAMMGSHDGEPGT